MKTDTPGGLCGARTAFTEQASVQKNRCFDERGESLLKPRDKKAGGLLPAWTRALRELLCAREVLSVRDIRRGRLQYFFLFPAAMLLVNVQNLFLNRTRGVFELSAAAACFLAFAAGAMAFFLGCRAGNTAAVTRAAAGLALAGALAWSVLPAGAAASAGALAMMAGVGGCVGCGSFSFVFVLNNTERFFSSALMLVSISFVKYLSGLGGAAEPLQKIFALALTVLLGVCALLSRRADYAVRPDAPHAMSNHGLRLALFIFFSYFAIRITGFYAPAFAHPASPLLRGLLTVVPVLLCTAAQLVFQRSIWTLCNVFFLSSVLSYVFWYAGLGEAAHVFSSFKDVGLLVAFYLIGCVTDKFCDFRTHKRLVLLCMAAVGALYLGVELLHAGLPAAPVVTSAGLFAVFLLLSPAFSQHLFMADWSRELRAAHMVSPDGPAQNALDAQVRSLDATSLSPREKQVALLLLQGMTLRQAAPELGLTASTVATYSKTLYKKLGINSRAELFLRFGARPAPPGEPHR